ncbi:MAG: hypothetical protein RMJ86_10740 [Anaerolineae bacterium]|nr:hypothetical protein [Anaerolineae bacterium]
MQDATFLNSIQSFFQKLLHNSKMRNITLLPVIAIWVTMLSLYWPYTVDDAYIIFRYSSNWAKGFGLVYNPGVPVDGYTSFLWTFLLGFWARYADIPIDTAAKISGSILSFISLLAVWHLSTQMPFISSRWIATLLTASAPSLVISSIEGLETPLYTAIQMLLLSQWLRDQRKGRLSMISGVLAGALTLTRPDGVLLSPILLIIFYLFHRRSISDFILRSVIPFTVGWALVYVPYFVWHFSYYGKPFPNTFYAKPGGHLDQLVHGLLRISSNIQEIGGWTSVILAILAFSKGVSPYNALMGGAILSRVLFHVWSGGEVMGHHRFLAPALPAYFLLLQLGLDTLIDLLRSEGARLTRISLRLVPLLLSGYMILAPLLDLRPSLLQYSQGLYRAHIQLGLWLRQHTPPTTRIAIGDAGAVPFYSERYTIDLMGLNDAHIAHLRGRYGQKIDVAYVLNQEPDYLILLSSTPPTHGFRGLTPVDGAIYEAISRAQRYKLKSFYQFSEDYFLWVFANAS